MIEYSKGNKAEGDLIVRVNGHQLTFKELAEICVQLCKNEDKIYPFPYQGGAYLTNFLVDCMDAREVSDAILNKYHLNETPKNGSSKNLQLEKSNFNSDKGEQEKTVEEKSFSVHDRPNPMPESMSDRPTKNS